MIVRDKKSGIRHLADPLGTETFCGLDARGMDEIIPPPQRILGGEGYEKWEYRTCNCSRCLRSIEDS